MKKLIYIVLLLLVSCKQDNCTKINQCELLSDIYIKDQKYRGMKIIEDPFFKVFDSVRLSKGITKKDYIAFSKSKQLEFGKKIKALIKKQAEKKLILEDSLMSLQKNLDIENTKILIKFIKNCGYPNIKNLKCEGKSIPFLIFVHSPEIFWEEIKEIINIEKKKKRITKGDYDYILWHISGRKGTVIDSKQFN